MNTSKALRMSFPDTEIINEDDWQYANRFYRIALSPIGSWYGVFANSEEDAFETLGAWCDDNAPGYIVDTTKLDEGELEDGSFFFVNGAPDCALDLSECMLHMFQEYIFDLTFTRV